MRYLYIFIFSVFGTVILFLSVLFLTFNQPVFAAVETVPENLDNPPVPQILREYTIKDKINAFLDKVISIWHPINEGGSGWLSGGIAAIKKWYNERVEEAKLGLQEEKQELKQELGGNFLQLAHDFFQGVWQNVWQKIKERF